MSDFHGNTRRMLGANNALYTSDVKFGYEKKPNKYLYLVDGQKLSWLQVRELVPDTIKDFTLRNRLASRHSTTLEWLSRPISEGVQDSVQALLQHRVRQRRGAERSKIQKTERDAYYRRKAACHKEL